MKHELSSMKAFVILAESSSFNNAAKLLNITQPALTRRIKKMEEDLHIQLFERTTRKVTLTKAGKRLLPEARELIKKFDETLFNIRDMNAYHRGMVTLGNDSNLLIVFYVQIMPDDLVMQLHRF